MTQFGLPIALTMGDPASIGPEITAKAWAQRDTTHAQGSKRPWVLFGDYELAAQQFSALGLPVPVRVNSASEAESCDHLYVVDMPCAAVTAGQPSIQTAPTIIASIENAVAAVLDGTACAVVTNPIAKDVLYKAGFEFPGHTELLGKLTAQADAPYSRGPVMMLSGGGLRVALATIHTPLRAVASEISTKNLIKLGRLVHEALVTDFGIAAPRIALCGLNPHAGENGSLGREEIDIITPAANALRQEGIAITDPQSADTLFHAEARAGYDAAIAMYHDQGLIPVKTLDFHGGVNITLGLPIVRTSPDHGTAFNIAGRGLARPDSLLAAIKAAGAIATQRGFR